MTIQTTPQTTSKKTLLPLQIPDKKIVIQAEGITKSFSRKNILNDITFSLREQKIYGFIGQNGAGKSTLIKILSGVIKADRGVVKKNIAPEEIGCMPEKPALYQEMTAEENLEITRRMYGIKEKSRIEELLQTVGLQNTGKKRVRQYSLGMKMRLSLAKAIMNRPKFLMLDEPLNGLDPVGTEEILHMLTDMTQKQQTTILISSHMLSELEQIATDYLILQHGMLTAAISEKEIFESRNRGENLKDRIMGYLMEERGDKL